LYNLLHYASFFLRGQVESPPGRIIGPISMVLGTIINFIYNIVSSITPVGALGISIIVMTVLFRTISLPLSIRQARSQMKMQDVAPEIQKIKDKYGDTTDPELKRKMQLEQQQVYQKHGINPLASCLPMLLPMPIFIAMFYMMRQAFIFVGSINDIYHQLAYALSQLDNFVELIVHHIAPPRVPAGMFPFFIGAEYLENTAALINVLEFYDWQTIFTYMTGEASQAVYDLYFEMQNVISFAGLNLMHSPGFTWPGMLVPLLSGATTFLQSYLMQARNRNAEASQAMMQKIMMYAMPLLMGFFSAGIAAGVGVYWIAGNIYAIVQQYFLNKHVRNKPAIVEGDIVKTSRKTEKKKGGF